MSKNIVIAAAQAADSISALDAEVAAVRAVHVDTALSPNLARDVQTLQKTVAQWPNGLRARARATMTAVVTETTQASTEWKAVDRTDTKAMLGFAESLRDLLVRHAGFQKASVRRPIPHESWYAISGYFYLYGHAYAAYVLETLPQEEQDALWPNMLEAVLYCRQPDGSFWDYPLYSYHKPYGTAFALIALNRTPADTQLPARED